jgi:hypothetical protein
MNGLQYKAFRLNLKSDDLDAKTGEFEGYVAAFGNVDHDGDIIEHGAFTKTVSDNGGVFPGLWQHDIFSPIGVSESMTEDDNGLKVNGRFAMGTQRGREAFELLSMGALKGFSIGYLPIKDAPGTNGADRTLKEIRLFEWSTVTFPANELAVVTGMKAADVLSLASRLTGEVKEGRRLSSASKEKIGAAIAALSALLEEDEPEKSTQPNGEVATKEGQEPSPDTLELVSWVNANTGRDR